jgi:hypothetical protein
MFRYINENAARRRGAVVVKCRARSTSRPHLPVIVDPYRIRFTILSALSASARCSAADFSKVAFDETNLPSAAFASSRLAATRSARAMKIRYIGRRYNAVKVLYWHRNGFAVWQRKSVGSEDTSDLGAC